MEFNIKLFATISPNRDVFYLIPTIEVDVKVETQQAERLVWIQTSTTRISLIIAFYQLQFEVINIKHL